MFFGFMACIGMGFGGYTDDALVFAFYWIAHAIPAVGGYTTCTFLIPIARWKEDGIACANLSPVVGSAVNAVSILEMGLYWCYVVGFEDVGQSHPFFFVAKLFLTLSCCILSHTEP